MFHLLISASLSLNPWQSLIDLGLKLSTSLTKNMREREKERRGREGKKIKGIEEGERERDKIAL